MFNCMSADLIFDLSHRSEENTEKVTVERTVSTVRNLANDTVTLRAERPALLLSSTSWTGERKRKHVNVLHSVLFIADQANQKV